MSDSVFLVRLGRCFRNEMRRFWRRLYAPKSDQLASAERVKAEGFRFCIGLSESGEDYSSTPNPKAKLEDKRLDFDSQHWPSLGTEIYDDLLMSTTGHYLMRSAFTDKTGKRLGRDKVHVFVISPTGRVICEETNGLLTHPPTTMKNSDLERNDVLSLEKQIEVSQRALDVAFRKNRHTDAAWQRRAKLLETLEAELAQTMKNIRQTKRHAALLKEANAELKKQICNLRDHDISKLEGKVCQSDPETFKRYSELKSSRESGELLRDISRRLVSLQQLRDLTARKCANQKAQEKAAAAPCARKQGDKTKVCRVPTRGNYAGLVQQLVRIADTRRRDELRPPTETDL